ncbi:MAG: adenylate/guanylate cyclase domain-containing response regulator [Anaerolineales bacterium]|nr:adenylate/guanylate cyclase domain-containing response regulator [Anaerolineales bacterium]
MIIMICIVMAGLALAGWNIYHLIQINNQMKAIQNDNEQLSKLEASRLLFQQSEVDLKNYLLTNDKNLRVSYSVSYAQVRQDMDYLVMQTDSGEAKEDLLHLQAMIGAFHDVALEIIRYWQVRDLEKVGLRIPTANEHASAVLAQFDTLIYAGEISLRAESVEIDQQIQRAVIGNIAGMLLISSLSVFAAIIMNQIAEPLLYLTNAVVSFENNAYQDDLLAEYVRGENEMGQLARAIQSMAGSISRSVKEKERFLKAANRFVPTEFLEFLDKRDITEMNLGDHISAEMAIMFSDIRSFTTMSEKMTPQENFDFVNEYLMLVSPLIKENHGFIVKFLGDGMMAIFPYGVDDAIIAGIAKQKLLNTYNAKRLANQQSPISVGIGIHSGGMMMGIVGEARRMQGDAFSDSINLTARIEGLTKFYGVSLIVTEEALSQAADRSRYRERLLGKAQVKGKLLPLTLYELFDGDPPDLFSIKLEYLDSFERGLSQYIAGDFSKARQNFEAVLQIHPEDKAAAFYQQRSLEMAKMGAPDDWQGIEIMTQK